MSTTPFPGSAYVLAGIFFLFLGTTVGGALLAVLSHRIIHSVCGLAVMCLGLAGLYYYLNSPFLALMEILIYVGAVCVTIVFGVMLAETDEVKSEQRRTRSLPWLLSALVVAAAVFWSAARLGLFGDWPALAVAQSDGSVQAIGVSLLTTYSMAFEAISIVLLIAILGALAIARSGRHRS
jgi:NADH-quinone oxidoreductase subunit J